MTKIRRNADKQKISVILGLSLLLCGGFFDVSVAAIGVIITAFLFGMLLRGKTFYQVDKRIVFKIPVAILWLSLLVSFWSIDYMENLMGVMRIGVVCLWIWMVRCNREEIDHAQRSIPFYGCIMVLLSLPAYVIPSFRALFWENSRMSGFFQYANTSALFLAMGLVLLIYRWREYEKNLWKILQLCLLIAGLLLTGSRSILLLVLAWGIYYAFRTKEFRKPFLFAIALFVALSGLYVAILGNTSNVGRIFSIFSSNSTFWGRLLYAWDAIKLLTQKFYGLGRMGYYYTQGTFQSGVYHIRFVHNDFLQIALDYGVIALVLLVVFLGWQLLCGKQRKQSKELLCILCLASLVDFHCQYVTMMMIGALFLDYGECLKEPRKELRENHIILPIFCIAFLYIAIATGFSKIGKQDMALSLLPDYTNAQEQKMLQSMGMPEGYAIAEKLMKRNPYNINATIVMSYYYASQNRVRECVECLDQMLVLDPYNVEYYKQYDQLLQNIQLKLVELAKEEKSYEEDLSFIQARRDALPEQLAALAQRTSFLAYKIKDEPIFVYK